MKHQDWHGQNKADGRRTFSCKFEVDSSSLARCRRPQQWAVWTGQAPRTGIETLADHHRLSVVDRRAVLISCRRLHEAKTTQRHDWSESERGTCLQTLSWPRSRLACTSLYERCILQCTKHSRRHAQSVTETRPKRWDRG